MIECCILLNFISSIVIKEVRKNLYKNIKSLSFLKHIILVCEQIGPYYEEQIKGNLPSMITRCRYHTNRLVVFTCACAGCWLSVGYTVAVYTIFSVDNEH